MRIFADDPEQIVVDPVTLNIAGNGVTVKTAVLLAVMILSCKRCSTRGNIFYGYCG